MRESLISLMHILQIALQVNINDLRGVLCSIVFGIWPERRHPQTLDFIQHVLSVNWKTLQNEDQHHYPVFAGEERWEDCLKAVELNKNARCESRSCWLSYISGHWLFQLIILSHSNLAYLNWMMPFHVIGNKNIIVAV